MLLELVFFFSSLIPTLKIASKSFASLVAPRSFQSDGWSTALIALSCIVLWPHRANTPSLINLSD